MYILGSNTHLNEREENKMDSNYIEKLSDQIWITRISRVNAEKRLQHKDMFIQGINVYYSCVTILFSVLSYINKDEILSLLATFVTIFLLISILFLNSQQYSKTAKNYKDNYTELQKLEFKLKHVNIEESDKIVEIEKNYCDLMNTYSNHITYDYYRTIFNSNKTFKEKHNFKYISFMYFFGVLWRFILQVIIILLPILLYVFRGVLLSC